MLCKFGPITYLAAAEERSYALVSSTCHHRSGWEHLRSLWPLTLCIRTIRYDPEGVWQSPLREGSSRNLGVLGIQARVWGASHHRGPRHRIFNFFCALDANGVPCFVSLYSLPFVWGPYQRQPFAIFLLLRHRSVSTACAPGTRRAPRVIIWCGFWRGFILVPFSRCCCKFSTIFVERTKKLGFVDEFLCDIREVFSVVFFWLVVPTPRCTAAPLAAAECLERQMMLWGERPAWAAWSAFWGGLVSKGAA